jgi:hypothetical protein
LLGSSKTPSGVKAIQWKFSVPVFGKRVTGTTTTATKASTAYDITKAIESGATIESAEEISSVNNSSTALTRTSAKSSYVIYRESRLIISWWRIIFIRRLSTCRTQKEYLEVIEQYRQILYGRFAQYLTVYGSSVSKSGRRALEESIEETKATLENEVFTKSTAYLKNLKSDDIVSTKDFEITTLVNASCASIDKKYEGIVAKAEKSSFTSESSSGKVITQKQSESETVDDVLVIVDTIQITIRYWFRALYGRISEASKNGAKTEEIQKLIKESHRELQGQLTKLGQSATSTLKDSAALGNAHKEQFEKSVTSIMEKTNSELNQFVSNVDVATATASAAGWKKLTGAIDNKLSLEFNECKTTVNEYNTVSEVESEEEKERATEISEEDAECSRIEVVTSLAESKAYISSWFANLSKDISWSVNSKASSGAQKDTLTIVDAAELDIISKIDESLALLTVLSSSLTYLSWTERRRLVTSYISIKTYLLANIKKFRYSITESTDKDAVLKICESAFGEDEQFDVLKNIDQILNKVTTTTTVSATCDVVFEETKDTSAIVDTTAKTSSSSINVGTVAGSAIVGGAIAGGIIAGTVTNNKDASTEIETTVNESDSVTIGIIAGGEDTSSTVDTDTNNSESVTIGVVGDATTSVSDDTQSARTAIISGETDTSSKVDIITKDSQSVTVGVLAGEGKDKATPNVDIITSGSGSITVGAMTTGESTTLEAIVNDTDAVTIGVKTSEKTESKESEAITVRATSGEKNVSSEVDSAEKHSSSHVIEAVAGGVLAGGIIAEIISAEKDTVSKVDVINKDSETVTVDVVAGGEKDVSSKTDIVIKESEDISLGVISGGETKSDVDVITKETESLAIAVIADRKIASGSTGYISEDSKSSTVSAINDKENADAKIKIITKDAAVAGAVAGVAAGVVTSGTKSSSSELASDKVIIQEDESIVIVGEASHVASESSEVVVDVVKVEGEKSHSSAGAVAISKEKFSGKLLNIRL